MNVKTSHVTVFVNNQEEALDFYTTKLGFDIAADVKTPDGFRWLTVAPASGDVELVLFPIGPQVGMSDELTAALKVVMASGYCGPCIFTVQNCAETHAELVAKGVTVQQEPHEEFYGVQASYLDNSGNVLTLVQA